MSLRTITRPSIKRKRYVDYDDLDIISLSPPESIIDEPQAQAEDPLEWSRPASAVEGDVLTRTHHTRYYIDDQCVVLQVENKLFKVHRYFLRRESSVFRDIFFEDETGLDDTHPIVLQDVKVKEMEALLNHFYHGMDDNRTRSLDEWIALLNIAHRFQFKDLCTRATNAVDTANPPLDAVKKVLLGQQLGITRLVLSGYVQLCKQKEFVSAENGETLGGRVTALLGQARERVQKAQKVPKSISTFLDPQAEEDDVARQIVQKVFGL